MRKDSYIPFVFVWMIRNYGAAAVNFAKAFDYMASIRSSLTNGLLNFYSSLSFAGVVFDSFHSLVGFDL